MQNLAMEKMKVFLHLVYECKKGIRSIALCTLPECCRESVCKRLDNNKIKYLTHDINSDRFNIFFGEKMCVEALKLFCNKPLNKLSPEEDFILGAMLGYSIPEQCKRYCKRNQEQLHIAS